MIKKTITINCSNEKYEAVRLYIKERGSTIEKELSNALDQLYLKTVPSSVRTFIEMKEHSQKKAPATDIASASTRSGGTEDEESAIWDRN